MLRKAQSVNILIYFIAGLIALVLLLQFYPKIRQSMTNYTKDQCFQEIIGMANVESPEDIQLRKCPVKKITINEKYVKKIRLDQYDKKFMKEQSKDELTTKINKIFADALINCFRKTGSGELSLYSKVETRDFNQFKDKSICVFCYLIELSDDIYYELKRRYGDNLELRDLNFLAYLNYRPSYKGNYYEEMRQKNPLLAYFYFAEENFNFKLDSKYYLVFTSYYASNSLDELFYTPAKALFKIFTHYAIQKLVDNIVKFFGTEKETRIITNRYISLTSIIPYYNDQEIDNICSYVVNK